jgi:hypothetical protein
MNKSRKLLSWKAIAAFGAVLVTVSTVANNFSLTFSNFYNLHKGSSPTVAASATSAQPPLPSSPKTPVPKARSTNSTSAPFQLSTGDQSPNLRNVKKSLRLQYGASQGSAQTEPTRRSVAALPLSIPKASAVQISTGRQSANIDGVAGDVDIRFTQPASTEGESLKAPNADN